MAAPIEASAAANVLSPGSQAVGAAEQHGSIEQDISGSATADAPQHAGVTQDSSGASGADAGSAASGGTEAGSGATDGAPGATEPTHVTTDSPAPGGSQPGTVDGPAGG